MRAKDRRELAKACETLEAVDRLIAKSVYEDEIAISLAQGEAHRHLGLALKWVNEMSYIADTELAAKIGRPRKAVGA